MPLDPDAIQAAAQVVEVISPGSLGGLVANGLPSATVLGTVAFLAYKRVQKAEETLKATLKSCKELLELHTKTMEANDEVVKVLESLMGRDTNQHAHNRWTQNALKLMVRRLGQTRQGGDVDADALELDLPPERDPGLEV